MDNLGEQIGSLLNEIQANLLAKATQFRKDHISEPCDYDHLKENVQNGWAYAWWCGNAECEAKVKEETKAGTRCIPLNQEHGKGKCIYCGKEATEKVYFAKAY